MGLSVRRILLASVIGNSAICTVKIVGGAMSGSTALLADGSDSLLNVVSGAIAYRFKAEAEKPPDSRHRYGHYQLEAYGSLIILMLMIATFSFVGFLAVSRLLEGLGEKVDPVGIPFAVTSLLLNLSMVILLEKSGGESTIAKTESRHVTLDVVEGLLALSGVSLGAYVSILYDVLVAFALLAVGTFFVIKSLREIKPIITAESPPEEIVRMIEETIRGQEGVMGVHDLRIRQAGAMIFADVHLEVDKRLSVEDAHRICDEVEARIKQRLSGVDILIHVEPGGESGHYVSRDRRERKSHPG